MSARHEDEALRPRAGKVEIEIGFGEHTRKQEVEVEDGDAPPWDVRTSYATVGTDHLRVDGLMKASGRAKYAYDVTFPGLLQGMVYRSPVARGKLTALELDEARKIPGVAAVVQLKDVGNKVRFVGDEIAAVCAPTLDICRDAIEAIRAQYDTDAHVVDFLAADDGPIVDDTGDLVVPWPASERIDAALGTAATTHEGTYRTEVQTHSSLETHGGVAKWNGDDLDVWMSTQATFGVRGELAGAMQAAGIPCKSVTVHAEFVGGGFGSKFTSGVEGRAVALLAREAGAPVKMMLDRFEEHTCTGNRPAALMQIRAGLDQDGFISTWDWRSFGGVGHNGSGGAARVHGQFLSRTGGQRERLRSEHKDVATDTDPARPMRAPGYLQGYFGGELFLDELAVKAGIDPLALRQKNDPQVIRSEQYKIGAERFGWHTARNPAPGTPMAGDDPRYLRGAGMATARWGGLGSSGQRRGRDGTMRGTAHGITCRIHPDGSVETRSGAQDIGSGMKTVMAMLTAEELGITTQHVTATMGHTSDPSGPASGGSTTTASLAPAVRHAAFLARQELAKVVCARVGGTPDQARFGGGNVAIGDQVIAWRDACKLIGPNPIEVHGRRFDNYSAAPFDDGVCGVQFAEVEVDTWTGLVRVRRMLAVQDCGLVIAKKTAESQVLGAMIQGLSYALHEQRVMDPTSGRMLNGDFLRYKVAGPQDMPEMECILMSVANGHTNTGAAGIGEAPSVAAPAAVANAVYNAIGVPVRHLPILPDKVLRALEKRGV